MKRTLFIALLAFLCTFLSAQTPGEKKNYRATFITSPPVIDGVIDDESWQTIPWEGDFIQFEPVNGGPVSQKTEFKVLFDENNIYVAIKAWDTAPDSISRRISRRDNADGDFVGVSFDSYHDLRTGFTFIVNAAGVKNDFIWSNDGQNEDDTWDPIWFTKAEMYDWGWAAEIKIPLTQLRFRISDGGIWGMEVVRNLYRNQEFSTWQFIDRNSSGLVHNFGEISGLQGIKPRKQADITPFAVGSYERYEEEEGNPFAGGSDLKGNVGLDAKIGITNNMTLDLTINPDFGQVEADPSEVNLTAYETFFEEKRPFFIEGKSITSFKVGIGDGDIGNDNLFYSRRIGRSPHLYADTEENEFASSPRNTPIISAAKITGKTSDGLSVGILEAVTAEAKAEIDSLGERSYQTVEPLTNYLVTRVMKDYGGGKTVIGGAFTNTHRFLDGTGINGLVTNANTAGIDFTRFFGKEREWMLSTSAAVSNLTGSTEAIEALQYSSAHYYQRPDADYVEVDPTRTSLNGHGGNIQFGKVGGHWNFAAFGLWKSPGFDINDLGFMQSADELTAIFWSAYIIDKPFSIFRRIRFNGNQWNFWDWGGTFLNTGGNLSLFTQFKNLWTLNIGGNINSESTDNTKLRGGPAMYLPSNTNVFLNIGTNSSKKLSMDFFGNINTGAENSSRSINAGLELTAKPGQSFYISLSPSISNRYNVLQYVTRKSYGDDDRYILATINQQILNMSLRLNYNITPELTIQYWGQPFLAAMDYSEYKMVTDPKADAFTNRFHTYSDDQISFNDSENRYYIDENTDGTTDYSFSNPDGNFDEFLSNLVVRWEYRPGSIIYVVWSQNRGYFDNTGEFSMSQNMSNLFSTNKPYDTFLIKFTYRFGLR
ncbi:MAG: carbohydrate binding family 9 domain-containing protein [Bacteroidales bacterium]|jgi:hypothetical protein|nr:carbohydrate binding family 9 domain-containing protein [Bacteroidales bacterium]